LEKQRQAMRARDARFFGACEDAKQLSDDPDTQVACVFVGHKGGADVILARGSNTLVRGCTRTDARVTRPGKYTWIEHAERNAIYSAARAGVSLEGAVAYVTLWPCLECARAIVQCGAAKVVAPSRPDLQDERWGAQFRLTQELFDDVGLPYAFADDGEALAVEEEEEEEEEEEGWGGGEEGVRMEGGAAALES
jgi:dCMP deaminase